MQAPKRVCPGNPGATDQGLAQLQDRWTTRSWTTWQYRVYWVRLNERRGLPRSKQAAPVRLAVDGNHVPRWRGESFHQLVMRREVHMSIVTVGVCSGACPLEAPGRKRRLSFLDHASTSVHARRRRFKRVSCYYLNSFLRRYTRADSRFDA